MVCRRCAAKQTMLHKWCSKHCSKPHLPLLLMLIVLRVLLEDVPPDFAVNLFVQLQLVGDLVACRQAGLCEL